MHRLNAISKQLTAQGISTFRAVYFEQVDGTQKCSIRELTLGDLPKEDVLVQVEYSALNYKDAMAITNSGPIIKQYPMVAGIDYAGTVVESRDAAFKPGDRVVMNGWGAGETRWGGYSQYTRTKGDYLLLLPPNFTSRTAMAIGTAGYTAMVCILKLMDHNIHPNSGPVLVTGAGGGVGSFAVALLSSLGYRVVALTGRVAELEPYLKALGAAEVVDRAIMSGKPKPLGKQIYVGAVDTVGGVVLANLLSSMMYGGVVTATGVAGGAAFQTTVMPFILRDVTLTGVDSNMLAKPSRVRAWDELARLMDPKKLDMIAPPQNVIGLDDLEAAARNVISGKHRGRLVVDMNK